MSSTVSPQQQQANKTPASKAIASFLRYRPELKQRNGIIDGKIQPFFRVKRAVRALLSDDYKKLQKKKGSELPVIGNKQQAIEAFRQLPLNNIAFRVAKIRPGDPGAPTLAKLPKDVVPIQMIREQEFGDDLYYSWFWEPIHFKTYIYAIVTLLGIFAAIFYPLWPSFMITGVWYLTVAALAFVAFLIVVAIVRLILFVFTYFAFFPGIWLFPNLFEDVGIIESFCPFYAWNEKKPKRQRKSKSSRVSKASSSSKEVSNSQPVQRSTKS